MIEPISIAGIIIMLAGLALLVFSLVGQARLEADDDR